MISVEFIGGLGNQMFIYAFAKAIEQKGLPVYLSTHHYDVTQEKEILLLKEENDKSIEHRDIRNLEILSFDLSLPLDFNLKRKFKRRFKNSIIAKMAMFLNYELYLRLSRVFYEDNKIFQNDSFPFLINPNSHLSGYFQELRYFEHIRSLLVRDFKLKSPLSARNQSLKERIINTPNSCFLHIRRGDYLKEENWRFVELGSIYYENAIGIIKNYIKCPNFFIFSNDIAWCKQNFLQNLSLETLDGANFYFVDQNDEGSAIEEMELMRACQNGIIANSTFSWWAGYLIENPSKVIVAPTHFHYYESITQKLIPRGDGDGKWIAINFTWKEKRWDLKES